MVPVQPHEEGINFRLETHTVHHRWRPPALPGGKWVVQAGLDTFYWHLVPLQVDLDDVTNKMLTCILLILQFLPFLESGTF